MENMIINKIYGKIKMNISYIRPFLVKILPFTIFIGILAFVSRNLFTGDMIAVPDISPFPNDIWPLVDRLSLDWTRIEYGISQPIEISYITRILFILVSGGDPVLAQRLYMITPLFLSFSAMYYFSGKIVDSQIARFLAALFYVSNPVTIVTFSTATGYLYVQAILPIILYLMSSLPVSEGRARIRVALIFSVILAAGYSFGRHMALFAIPIIAYGLVKSLLLKPRSRVLKSIIWIFSASFLGAFLVVLSHYPELKSMLGYVTPGGGGLLSFSGYGVDFSAYSALPFPIFLEILSLQMPGFFGWAFDSNMVLLSLFFPLFAFVGLIKQWKGEQKRLVVFSTVLISSIVLYIYLSYLGLTTPLIQLFRLFIALRNEQLPLLFLSFVYAILMALSFSMILGKTNQFKRSKLMMSVKSIVVIVILVPLVLPSLPFYNGDFGLSDIHENSGSYGLYIPDKYYNISNWIEEKRIDGESFRTLWFPNTFSDVGIKTLYLDTDLAFLTFGSEKFVDPTFVQCQSVIFAETFEKKTVTHFGSLVSSMAVKYIVLDLGSNQTGPLGIGESFVYGDPKLMLDVMQNQKDLRLILNGTDFIIFENLAYIPPEAFINGIMYIKSDSESCNDEIQYLRLLVNTPGFTLRDNLPIFSSEISDENIDEIISISKVILKYNNTDEDGSFDLPVNKSILSIETAKSEIFEERSVLRGSFIIDEKSTYTIVFWSKTPKTININGTEFEPSKLNEEGLHEFLDLELDAGLHDLLIRDIDISEEELLSSGVQIIGEWILSEIRNEAILDTSGFGNMGIVNGTYSKDNAIYFSDGDHIEIPYFGRMLRHGGGANDFKLEPFTVETWITPSKRGGAGTIVSIPEMFTFRVNGKNLELHLFHKHAVLQFRANDVITGNLQQIAFSYDGNLAKIYVDGEVVANADWDLGLISVNNPLYMGIREKSFLQDYSGSMAKVTFFQGIVDDTTMRERIREGSGFTVFFEYSIFESNIWNKNERDEDLPRFVFLSEPFDKSWNAHFDGMNSDLHFPAFLGMNLFYYEDEYIDLEFVNNDQKSRNLEILLMGISWFSVFGIIVASYKKPNVRSD